VNNIKKNVVGTSVLNVSLYIYTAHITRFSVSYRSFSISRPLRNVEIS